MRNILYHVLNTKFYEYNDFMIFFRQNNPLPRILNMKKSALKTVENAILKTMLKQALLAADPFSEIRTS